MKRLIVAAIAATTLAAPALAKDVQLTLNEPQQQALLQVLDKATRDGGLAAANSGTVYFFNLLKNAVDAANAPPPPPAPEAKAEPEAKPEPKAEPPAQ